MKIAAVTSSERGKIDQLMSEVAKILQDQGVRVLGIVKKFDSDQADQKSPDADVRVLPDGPVIRITQSLGEGSKGCRLNPVALTECVAEIEKRHDAPYDFFILNKFGPEEAEGRGFVSAIGHALEQNVPVLVGVSPTNKKAFDAFAGEVATALPDEIDDVLNWCHSMTKIDA